MRTKSIGLTKKQKEVLTVIKKFYAENKYPPSVRQIGEIIGINSPATIHVHLKGLVEKGYVKRNPYGNNAIELLVPNEYDTKSDEVVNVPLIKEENGNYLLELETPNEIFSIPTYLADEDVDVYAMQKISDDMIGSGILSGDIVIVKRCEKAKDGDMVVALDKNNLPTIKRLFNERGFDRLQTDNPEYDPIIVKKAVIVGKVVGLYRKF